MIEVSCGGHPAKPSFPPCFPFCHYGPAGLPDCFPFCDQKGGGAGGDYQYQEDYEDYEGYEDYEDYDYGNAEKGTVSVINCSGGSCTHTVRAG